VLAALTSSLQDRFADTALSLGDQITGIIALGGGLPRTREAIRLARLFPSAKLVVTGGSQQEYAIAREQLGPRIVVEPQARNTYENAFFTRRLVQPQPGDRWLVVTSAMHMPRAMGAFRGVGFPVEPWPIRDLQPTGSDSVGILRHEWLGLLAYRLMGRTDALFPGPFSSRPPSGWWLRLS
jgi:uncharacterized SAM-binding protein YcdF (DUF218 family)